MIHLPPTCLVKWIAALSTVFQIIYRTAWCLERSGHAKCSLQMRIYCSHDTLASYRSILCYRIPFQAARPSSHFSSFPHHSTWNYDVWEVFKFEEGPISFAKWPQSCSQKSNLGCRQCLPGKIRHSELGYKRVLYLVLLSQIHCLMVSASYHKGTEQQAVTLQAFCRCGAIHGSGLGNKQEHSIIQLSIISNNEYLNINYWLNYQ